MLTLRYSIRTGAQVVSAKEVQMGECLGCGATGAVYHAWWQGSEVAVKQLSLFCLDSRHIADFYAEAVRENCRSTAVRFVRNPPPELPLATNAGYPPDENVAENCVWPGVFTHLQTTKLSGGRTVPSYPSKTIRMRELHPSRLKGEP